MIWLRILANLPHHKKFIKAGPIASWLWIAGVGYSRVNETDGYLDKVVIPGLVPGLSNPFKHAATLVASGLWEDALEGYLVHDYMDWNPSKAEIEELRTSDSARKRDKRNVREASVRTNDGTQTDAFYAGAGVAISPSLSASASEAVELGEESARETQSPQAVKPSSMGSVSPFGGEALAKIESFVAPREVAPTWNPNGRVVRNRSLVGSHTGCYYAPDACERGLCVPGWLGAQWQAQCGDAAGDVRAFVTAELQALPPGPVGDPVKFWKARWDAQHAARATTATPKPAADATWAEDCQRLHASTCNGRLAHSQRLFIDAENAKAQ